MRRPSRAQRAFLDRLKIRSPTTRQASTTLIRHLLDGVNSREPTVGSRIALIRRNYQNFVGARVKVRNKRHELYGKEGLVEFLTVRPSEELRALQSRYPSSCIHPLLAVVSFDDLGGKKRRVALADLRIINPANQRLLF
jgi:hypothetical protein